MVIGAIDPLIAGAFQARALRLMMICRTPALGGTTTESSASVSGFTSGFAGFEGFGFGIVGTQGKTNHCDG